MKSNLSRFIDLYIIARQRIVENPPRLLNHESVNSRNSHPRSDQTYFRFLPL